MVQLRPPVVVSCASVLALEDTERNLWKSGGTSDSAPEATGWYYHDVDVTMPHWDDTVILDIRGMLPDSCTAGKWEFQSINLWTKNTQIRDMS